MILLVEKTESFLVSGVAQNGSSSRSSLSEATIRETLEDVTNSYCAYLYELAMESTTTDGGNDLLSHRSQCLVSLFSLALLLLEKFPSSSSSSSSSAIGESASSASAFIINLHETVEASEGIAALFLRKAMNLLIFLYDLADQHTVSESQWLSRRGMEEEKNGSFFISESKDKKRFSQDFQTVFSRFSRCLGYQPASPSANTASASTASARSTSDHLLFDLLASISLVLSPPDLSASARLGGGNELSSRLARHLIGINHRMVYNAFNTKINSAYLVYLDLSLYHHQLAIFEDPYSSSLSPLKRQSMKAEEQSKRNKVMKLEGEEEEEDGERESNLPSYFNDDFLNNSSMISEQRKGNVTFGDDSFSVFDHHSGDVLTPTMIRVSSTASSVPPPLPEDPLLSPDDEFLPTSTPSEGLFSSFTGNNDFATVSDSWKSAPSLPPPPVPAYSAAFSPPVNLDLNNKHPTTVVEFPASASVSAFSSPHVSFGFEDDGFASQPNNFSANSSGSGVASDFSTEKRAVVNTAEPQEMKSNDNNLSWDFPPSSSTVCTPSLSSAPLPMSTADMTTTTVNQEESFPFSASQNEPFRSPASLSSLSVTRSPSIAPPPSHLPPSRKSSIAPPRPILPPPSAASRTNNLKVRRGGNASVTGKAAAAGGEDIFANNDLSFLTPSSSSSSPAAMSSLPKAAGISSSFSSDFISTAPFSSPLGNDSFSSNSSVNQFDFPSSSSYPAGFPSSNMNGIGFSSETTSQQDKSSMISSLFPVIASGDDTASFVSQPPASDAFFSFPTSSSNAFSAPSTAAIGEFGDSDFASSAWLPCAPGSTVAPSSSIGNHAVPSTNPFADFH
jgi:hypothetical protein